MFKFISKNFLIRVLNMTLVLILTYELLIRLNFETIGEYGMFIITLITSTVVMTLNVQNLKIK